MREVINTNVLFDTSKPRHGDEKGVPWSHAVKASGMLLFVSGMTACDTKGTISPVGDIYGQTEATLHNLRRVVEASGFSIDDTVQLMWFVTDAEAFYAKGASGIRRKYFKRGYPSSTLVEIKRLADPKAMVEVQAICVKQEKSGPRPLRARQPKS